VAIVPKVFRGFDYEQMLDGLQPSLPELQHVVVVGGTGENSFEALLSGPHWEREPDARASSRATARARTTSPS
jgi:cyclohexanecarboxylate-CoA ligase